GWPTPGPDRSPGDTEARWRTRPPGQRVRGRGRPRRGPASPIPRDRPIPAPLPERLAEEFALVLLRGAQDPLGLLAGHRARFGRRRAPLARRRLRHRHRGRTLTLTLIVVPLVRGPLVAGLAAAVLRRVLFLLP